MKRIVEVHALQNFAPSNLNRDDTGAPKDALFGGTRRARVSSQCQKRAVRDHFRLQNNDWVSRRTKRIIDLLNKRIAPKMKNHKTYSEESLMKAIEIAVSSLGSQKKVKIDKDRKTDVLLFLSNQEVDSLESVILENYSSLAKPNISEKLIKKLNNSINGEAKKGMGLDVALFGRMLAVMPEKNQNAACQVAHAISTHAVEREFDFYTAIDDLKPEDAAGADMMGTVEFNSACFYRYAVVDWDKLIENLGQDGEMAARGLRAFLDGFVRSEPRGKQNTFAAHNHPKFVAVSVRNNTAPRSFANAFETAVRVRKDEGLTRKSAEAMVQEAKMLQAAYGGDGKTFVLNIVGADTTGFGIDVSTFNELLDRVISEAKG